MNYYFLTWNPKSKISSVPVYSINNLRKDYINNFKKNLAPIHGIWRASASKLIKPGDRFYLLAQGFSKPFIFGYGEFTSEVKIIDNKKRAHILVEYIADPEIDNSLVSYEEIKDKSVSHAEKLKTIYSSGGKSIPVKLVSLINDILNSKDLSSTLLSKSTIKESKIKNTNWEKEEIILAIALYFQLNRHNLSSTNPKIKKLSVDLRNRSKALRREVNESFRNPSGVAMKLSNFLSLDKEYKGKGLAAASNLDKSLFKQYEDNIKQLEIDSKNILQAIDNLNSSQILLDNTLDEDFSAQEGDVRMRQHKFRERNRKLVNKKKEHALKKYGKLECEICNFNFEEFYGTKLGGEFIECHHIEPISKRDRTTETKLEDLALVCANCHRMLHRHSELATIEELKQLISNKIN